MSTIPGTITVRLLSPMRMGAAPSQILDVDQDVVLDGNGLPYLPARRISSRLRDAMGEVLSAWKDPETVHAAAALLGERGGTGPGRLLAISDGTLDPSITEAVAVLIQRNAVTMFLFGNTYPKPSRQQ